MNTLDKDFKLILSATYIAEPIKEVFAFWQQKLGMNFEYEFTPLNSIFKELLDPTSAMRQNRFCNVIILRFDDWYRGEDGFEIDESEDNAIEKKVRRNLNELIETLTDVAGKGNGTYMVFVSPAVENNVAYDAKAMEEELISRLAGVDNVYLYPSTEVEKVYEVSDYYDAYTDAVGHVPYKQNYYEVFGTVILRKVLSYYRKPYKVAVLDCDNTLWKGILGEDGIDNIIIDENRAFLQQYMKDLKNKGVLLCLCSKNNDGEVQEAFDKLPGMILRSDDIVSWRINWNRKSENIKELAAELNLGLDSFVFIDDSESECMEVKVALPEVLTYKLPNKEEEIKNFVKSIWAFDIVNVTEADKTRTEKYKENIERNECLKSTSFEDFINGLELQVEIEKVQMDDYDRAYQMMLRINQFNFTAKKYDSAEFVNLLKNDNHIVVSVKAKDRFGDYGRIGLIVMNKMAEVLVVENMMLSCRALCKGIEYQMMSYVGKTAEDMGCDKVKILFEKTCKNIIAEQFLNRVLKSCQEENEVEAAFLAALEFKNYMAEEEKSVVSEKNEDAKEAKLNMDVADYIKVMEQIATELNSTDRIHKAIVKVRLDSLGNRIEYASPTNEIEEKIVQIWEEILEVDNIGINDNFFDLGGESIKAIQILSRVRDEFDADISIAVLFEGALTVAKLAQDTQDSILGSFDEELLASELAAIENMSEEELEALLNGEI